MSKVSFETLKAADSGRFLKTRAGRHEVKATVVTAADGREFLSLRTWIGSHPGPGATGSSEPSRWCHIILDDDMNIVATGVGKRDKDSWLMATKVLGLKGIDVTTVKPPKEDAAPSFVNPEYKGRSNSDLRAWLAYWEDESKSQDEADAIGSTRKEEIEKLTAELQARGAAG